MRRPGVATRTACFRDHAASLCRTAVVAGILSIASDPVHTPSAEGDGRDTDSDASDGDVRWVPSHQFIRFGRSPSRRRRPTIGALCGTRSRRDHRQGQGLGR